MIKPIMKPINKQISSQKLSRYKKKKKKLIKIQLIKKRMNYIFKLQANPCILKKQ